MKIVVRAAQANQARPVNKYPYSILNVVLNDSSVPHPFLLLRKSPYCRTTTKLRDGEQNLLDPCSRRRRDSSTTTVPPV